MGVFKQGEKWWYEFYVDGKRYRASTRTADKAVAELIESEHKRSLARGVGKDSPTLQAIKVAEAASRRTKIWEGIETQKDPPKPTVSQGERLGLTAKTLLQEAGSVFLQRQRELCRRKTVECNEGHVRRLVEFFGNIPLAHFTIAHFEHYQNSRRARCGASSVNHELNTLARILHRAGLWYRIKQNYAPLKDREAKPVKIFTAAEQERIFRALKSDPHLEIGDIELEADPQRIHIPPDSTKNNIRPRTIPLNAGGLSAMRRAVERAKKLGSHYPEDYLFPLRIDRATWDPKQPASRSWLRKQVVYLREVTGIDHINPHIFRHLAVTELLEQGAPEQTVIALAGWVGRKMIATYSHARIEAKSEAVELLDKSGHKAPERPTPKSTKQPTSLQAPYLTLPIRPFRRRLPGRWTRSCRAAPRGLENLKGGRVAEG
jgi:integrase